MIHVKEQNNNELNKSDNLIDQDNSAIILNNLNNSNINNDNNINIPESESYMNLIENELQKYGHKLNDSLFISQIIIILDQLSEPNSFNKTLFNHIIDFSKFDVNQPIKLLDFFKSYFQVYNTMKENRDKIAYENIQLMKEIEKTKIEINQNQINEIIREDGTTNNSKINFTFKGINSNEDKSGIRIKEIHVNYGDTKLSFDICNPYSLKEVKIYSMTQLENNIQVYIKTDLEDKLIDTINPKTLLENQLTRNYKYFEMSYLWINSLVNYLNRKIIKIEYVINTSKDNISMLNTSINQMENIFKNYFSQIPRSQNSNYISRAMGNEIEISDKVEKIVLKTIGKDIIVIWDKIIFFLNKVLFISILLELILRFDFITYGICVIIFFIELKIFAKNNLYYYLILLITSIIIDICYIIYIINFWSLNLPFDNPRLGLLRRQIGIILVIVNCIFKIILTFCFWKVALQNKLNLINQDHANRVINSQLQNEFNLNLQRFGQTPIKNVRDELLKKTQLRNKENLDGQLN